MNFKLELKKEAETVEVTQPVTQSFEELVTKLNRLAREAGFNDISPHAVEFLDWGNNTSTTTLFNRNHEDAFTLAEPVTGLIREYRRPGIHVVPEDYIGQVGVHRARVGYWACSRINNVNDMINTLKPIIDMGVKDLINQFGHLGLGYKISMQMPGYEGVYFRDLENAAAFEIRLFLTKVA